MQVESRAGKFFRGAEDGTSRALSCKRPNIANAAVPQASTKLDRTPRRELFLQATANGSKASNSFRIAPQNYRDRKQRSNGMLSIPDVKYASGEKE